MYMNHLYDDIHGLKNVSSIYFFNLYIKKLKMLELPLWLHRQYSQENIELFHAMIALLWNAGY